MNKAHQIIIFLQILILHFKNTTADHGRDSCCQNR